MQLYLAVTPEQVQQVKGYRCSLAHVAYRIGPSSTLMRQNLLLQTRGGLLCVNDQDAPVIDDPAALSAAVVRECGRRSYGGVLLDFESSPRPDRLAWVEHLGKTLAQSRRTLYVPESYAQAAKNAVVLVCTAISGGNFADRLQEAAAQLGGPARTALDVQRLRMDFLLPAHTGQGVPLQEKAFSALMEQENPSVFFSPDLCAKYFTYSRQGQTHFVLFDDASTLRQKLRTGTALGFSAAFFMFPEVEDLAGKLFAGS